MLKSDSIFINRDSMVLLEEKNKLLKWLYLRGNETAALQIELIPNNDLLRFQLRCINCQKNPA